VGNRLDSTENAPGWPLRPLAAALIAAGSLAPAAAAAATLTVTTLADSSGSACTLRDAVNSIDAAANQGACAASGAYGSADTVVFASSVAGTITFAAGDPLAIPPFASALVIRRSMAIVGPGSSQLTLTCGSTSFRLLEIDAGTPAVSLSGFTIDSCTASLGAGVFADLSSPNVAQSLQMTDVTLSNNKAFAGTGGGMAALGAPGATVSLTACLVTGNHAGLGAGLSFSDASGGTTVSIADSLISSNVGGNGGGISSVGVRLDVVDTTLRQNSGASGGAVIASSVSDVTFTRATIDRNTAAANGGGILVAAPAKVAILDSTVSNNRAPGRGGGVQFQGSSGPGGGFAATNSTLSGNLGGFGGAIAVTRGGTGALQLANTTIANNSAGFFGGGVYDENVASFGVTTPANVIDIVDTIVAGNLPQDTWSNEPAAPGGAIPWAVSWSLIGAPGNAILVGTGNIVGGAPPFGAGGWLGPLANNGGPTQTHALLTTVADPAIDAGDPSFSGLAFDQRGSPFTRVRNGRLDIGAFESGALHPPPVLVPVPGPGWPLLSLLSALLGWLGWRLRPRR
jgi:hypothetical protein